MDPQTPDNPASQQLVGQRHTPTQPLTHSTDEPASHLAIHPFIRLFIHSSIHPSVRPFVRRPGGLAGRQLVASQQSYSACTPYLPHAVFPAGPTTHPPNHLPTEPPGPADLR
ncbi:unnamed protein product [Protopolystoma xenopodis]|uniref:Uncharacterized protein n=1 Tax=Protopolystoma xenopodis TaxID=117903 RepID=A0A3S5A9B9_9PLAT|nr:unnamed protein product [Protopolystoma xenopodis]